MPAIIEVTSAIAGTSSYQPGEQCRVHRKLLYFFLFFVSSPSVLGKNRVTWPFEFRFHPLLFKPFRRNSLFLPREQIP
ncbi:MAG: hypothetical protein JW969_04910 [Spirochaetales bacterium]|nr:hypothetical protein [Spirochaetales bacterium]